MHRVLFIGVGSIGERHVRCFKATGRIEAAICETNSRLRHEAAERYQVKEAYPDLDAALAGSRVQYSAALIATPAHLHIPMAIQLAKAGVHLLIEKPLSTALEGVAELQRLVADRGLKAAVAYFWRTHPALTEMKQAIDAGRFGRPIQLVATTGQNFPFYRPAYREIYYKSRATGGGAIQDGLTHIINAGEWLVGPVDRLVADADHKVLEGVSVEDVAHVLTRHGPVMGCYSLNQFQAPDEGTLTVHCDRGSARFNMLQHNWQWMEQIAGEWHVETFGPFERDDLYTHQANVLLDVLEGRSDPPCTLAEALQTLRVNLAALRSADDPAKFIRA